MKNYRRLALLCSLLMSVCAQAVAAPCGLTVTSVTGDIPFTTVEASGTIPCAGAVEVRVTCDPTKTVWSPWQSVNPVGVSWDASFGPAELNGLMCSCSSRMFVQASCAGEICDENPEFNIVCEEDQFTCPEFSCDITTEELMCGTAGCPAGQTPLVLTPNCTGFGAAANPQFFWDYGDGTTSGLPTAGLPAADTHCYDPSDLTANAAGELEATIQLSVTSGVVGCPWEAFTSTVTVENCLEGPGDDCPDINCAIDVADEGCVDGQQTVLITPTCSGIEATGFYQHAWALGTDASFGFINGAPAPLTFAYDDVPEGAALQVQDFVKVPPCISTFPFNGFPANNCSEEEVCPELTNLTATYEMPPTIMPDPTVVTINIGEDDCIEHHHLPVTISVDPSVEIEGALTFKLEEVGSSPAVTFTKTAVLPSNSVVFTSAELKKGASYNVSVTVLPVPEGCQPQIGGTLHICEDDDPLICPQVTDVDSDPACIESTDTTVNIQVSGNNLDEGEVTWDLGDGTAGDGLPIPAHDFAGGTEASIEVQANKDDCPGSIFGFSIPLCGGGSGGGGGSDDNSFCGGEWWCCLLWALLIIAVTAALVALAWGLCDTSNTYAWMAFGIAMVLAIVAAALLVAFCDATACGIAAAIAGGGLGGGAFICGTTILPCTSLFCNKVTIPGTTFGVAGWIIGELGLVIVALLICLFA